ncbi:hypothetical protein V8E36_008922 [Tilletia maclaganii]
MGDFNVRLGELYGIGRTSPRARADVVIPWSIENGLLAVPAGPSNTPGLDHAFLCHDSAVSDDVSLRYFRPDAGLFPTDHQALLLQLPAPFSAAQIRPLANVRRPNLARLRQDVYKASLCDAYRLRAAGVAAALRLAEEQAASSRHTPTSAQVLVDCADRILHETTMDAALCALGTYDAQQVQTQPDEERQRLAAAAVSCTTAALRLWKRVLKIYIAATTW